MKRCILIGIFYILRNIVNINQKYYDCWYTRRSISADWSQPTSHCAVGFPDMISDNKLQTFSWISSFILLYNSECRIKDEDTIVGFCLLWLRFAIQILISKCLFSKTVKRILESNLRLATKLYCTALRTWVNANWSLKESDDQNRLSLYTIANHPLF